MPFVSTFKSLNKVVMGSFSNQSPSEDIDKYIKELRKCFEATKVSETLKIHVVLYHIVDALQFLNKRGLGLWSEQAGESIHREFVKFWNKYKINSIDDTTYGTRLKRAVVDFSLSHI